MQYSGVHIKGVLAAGCVLGAVVGCERSASAPPKAEEREGTIALIGASIDDPLWRVFYATAYRELEGYHSIELKIAAPRIPSVEAQINIIRTMRKSDLLGMCIQPVDPVALRAELEDLRTKGVMVVTLMNRVPSDNAFLFCGLDDLAIGEAMADAVAEWIGQSGTAAVMLSKRGDAHHNMRLVGLRKKLEIAPSVSILAEMDCDGNVFTARAMMREYMERFPRLRAWVTLGDWPLRRRKPGERFLPDTCRLVTFGPTPANWRFLEDGTCYALVGAAYDRVAAHAIQTCVTAIFGDAPHIRSYLAPPLVVKADNLHAFRARWFRWRELPLETQSTVLSTETRKP